MIVAVVADTHLKEAGKLPAALRKGLHGVDLIVHAGDWVSMDVVRELSELAPVEGVAGNGDGEAIARRFGKRKLLELEGIRCGLVHGHEGVGRTTPERALRAFRDDRPELIVFGHSHIPLLEQAGETTLFNPGSPTDKRRQTAYSFGIVNIRGGKWTAEHRFYTDKT